MKVFGKDISEINISEYRRGKMEDLYFPFYNLPIVRRDIVEGDLERAARWSCMDGNKVSSSNEILERIAFSYKYGVLTSDDWSKVIPLIEDKLQFNIDYLNLLESIAPQIEAFQQKYKEGNYTLMERFKLEFWQGRFRDKKQWGEEGPAKACYK